MKRSLVAACLLSLTFGTVVSVSAQSLAQIAKKEKERRKKVDAKETHSYSEQDLKSNGLRSASSTTASSDSATAADGSAATTTATGDSAQSGAAGAASAEDPEKTQAYWHDKVIAIDKKIQDLQTRLKSPEMTSNTRGAAERDKVQRDLARAQAERDALVDEARRKGVPPGWVR